MAIRSFNDPNNNLHFFSKKKNVKQFYILGHFFYGCENPKCEYVFDESEIQSKKIQNYIENHKYEGYEADIYQFESKLWKLDEVLQLKISNGWTPEYKFERSGFTFVGSIDLIGRNKHVSENGEITYSITRPKSVCNLEEKKEQIKAELEKLDYKNKNLIIYRTSRYGLALWDIIDFLVEGNQPKTKYYYRLKINILFVKEKLKSHIKKTAFWVINKNQEY